MKNFKRLFIILTFVFLVLFQVACGKKPSITVNSNNVELKAGETFKLEVTVNNVEENGNYTFKVDDNKVCKVENNTIIALNGGVTNVTVALEIDETVKQVIKVTVTSNPSITLTGPSKIYIDEPTQLTCEIHDITDPVEWSVDDETIATIDENGVITGQRKGTVIVNVTAGMYSKELELEVIRKPMITITGNNEVYLGETLKLKATLRFAEGELVWSTTDEEIATVNESGVVTPKASGEVVIVCSFEDVKEELKITVYEKQTITLTGKTTVNEFDKTKLLATNLDDDPETTVKWVSSDEEIATVNDEGLVFAIRPGKVRITCIKGVNRGYLDMTIKAYSKRLVYNYDGGVSEELYQATNAKATYELNNYGFKGGFWSTYPTSVYIGTKSTDESSTFSEKIYIGKNEYSGLYEVVGLLGAGTTSEWPKGAQYIINYSTSHQNHSYLENEFKKISVGDICVIDKDIKSIDNNNVAKCQFFDKEIDLDRLVILPENYKGELAVPYKLGYEFKGWYNRQGSVLTSLSEIKGNIELTAKWEILNPVKDITYTLPPEEIYTGDEFKLDAKIVPDDAFFKEALVFTSNKDVIDIFADGTLKAVSAGKVTITIRDYASQVVKTLDLEVKMIKSIEVKYPINFDGVLNVDETVTLEPTFLGKLDNPKFTYTVKDPSILSVDEAGVVKGLKQGNTEITIKVNDDKEYTLTIGLTVDGLSTADKVDEVIKLIAENNFATVQKGNMSLFNDGDNRYYKALYGSVNRYLFDKLVISRENEETATNNPNCHQDRDPADTIEFVTVHDTATLTSTAQSTAQNMARGETSIHYVVGEGKVYSCVPEKFIAYHAGDGTHYSFSWTDSKVKANGNNKPDFDLVKDGAKYYLVLNGEKTTIEVPVGNGSQTIKNPTKESFASLKPVYTIKNGTYHIGPMWVCFSQNINGVICSHGGNNNSIGIETSVNSGDDYYETMQRTAMLVADILIRNNLGLERVQQHNSWSGKNCPQSVRSGELWAEFMRFTTLQYTIMKDYKDVEISMVSNNPEYVSNTGKVIKQPTTAMSVSYDVTVKLGSTTKTIRLYSTIPGTTSWFKLSGLYPASVIWNNGHFC